MGGQNREGPIALVSDERRGFVADQRRGFEGDGGEELRFRRTVGDELGDASQRGLLVGELLDLGLRLAVGQRCGDQFGERLQALLGPVRQLSAFGQRAEHAPYAIGDQDRHRHAGPATEVLPAEQRPDLDLEIVTPRRTPRAQDLGGHSGIVLGDLDLQADGCRAAGGRDDREFPRSVEPHEVRRLVIDQPRSLVCDRVEERARFDSMRDQFGDSAQR